MLDRLREYRDELYVIGASFGASLIVGLMGLILAIVVTIRLPADYFQHERRPLRVGTEGGRPAWRLALRVGKNVLGWLLILAGLAMFVLPGPGMVVLLIGVMSAEFPGKLRLERWIVSRRRVLKLINRLRKRFGRPPLAMHASAPENPFRIE